MKHNNKFVANSNDWSVSAEDISLDLAILASDCFRGKLINIANKLSLTFDNGQRFTIEVKESTIAK